MKGSRRRKKVQAGGVKTLARCTARHKAAKKGGEGAQGKNGVSAHRESGKGAGRALHKRRGHARETGLATKKGAAAPPLQAASAPLGNTPTTPNTPHHPHTHPRARTAQSARHIHVLPHQAGGGSLKEERQLERLLGAIKGLERRVGCLWRREGLVDRYMGGQDPTDSESGKMGDWQGGAEQQQHMMQTRWRGMSAGGQAAELPLSPEALPPQLPSCVSDHPMGHAGECLPQR